MNKNWKRVGLMATVLAMSALMVFAGAAFAQGNGPANDASPVYGQANRLGNGSSGTGIGYGVAARGAWGGPTTSLTAVAADVIGIDQAALVAELQAGATIADVAAGNGVDVQDIVDAYLLPRTDTLNAAVAAGRITPDQADAMLAEMAASVTASLSDAWQSKGNAYGNCDGTCTGAGTQGQGGMGPNWDDADGDGTCDNFGTMQQNMRSGRGSNMSARGGRGNR